MKALLLFLACTFFVLASTKSNAQDAKSILTECRKAYGGDKLNGIRYIHSHHLGHTHWLEQSENPNGPFITSYESVNEVRSIKEPQLFQEVESRIFQIKDPIKYTWVNNGGTGFMKYGPQPVPMPVSVLQQQEQWILYDPLTILAKAEESNPGYEKIEKLEGVDHHRISFASGDQGFIIFINANTLLISEARIDTRLPYEFFFSLWGKFTTRIQYTLYALDKLNILYPMQWDVYRTGHLWKKITIRDIEFLPAIEDSVFSIPDQIREAAPPKKLNVNEIVLKTDKTIQVADGIFVIPGYWFTGWVEQQDGILIIEAPISSGFSSQLIAEVKKRYPGKKIKGVVVTSDAWPHLAGAREYFAMHIPVYTNPLNKQILDRVAAADYSSEPDQFQKNKQVPEYRFVDKETSIMDPKNPVRIFPVNGEGGERMVAVYFPKQKVLYASDLIQQMLSGEFFFPEYLLEVKNLIKRHGLDVQTVYAMHTQPIPWQQVEDALTKIK